MHACTHAYKYSHAFCTVLIGCKICSRECIYAYVYIYACIHACRYVYMYSHAVCPVALAERSADSNVFAHMYTCIIYQSIYACMCGCIFVPSAGY